ncbi:MAG: CPBP family intramembrane metalloprotease [Acidobacteria bacterium]|nr:CPBP family intramembrane metalloprotease [Acidobacteriota bacterium]
MHEPEPQSNPGESPPLPMVPEPRLPESEPELPKALRYPFWNYEDVGLFFGMGLPSLVLSVVVMEGISLLLPQKPSQPVYFLLAQMVGYVMWFASLVLLLRVRYDAPFLSSLAWVIPKQGFWRFVLQGPMLAFAVGFLLTVLRTPAIEMPFEKMLQDRYTLMLTGVFGVTIGPFCEELAFRGFLMPVLVRSLGVWPGIIVAALPFSLLHGPQYAWSWRHLLVLTLVGTAFGRVRYITGSTAAAALTHASYNLTLFSALIAQGALF